ncbi:MAG: DsrE family protein [Sphingomonas sp.]|jgi:predicted peroxiredoxin
MTGLTIMLIATDPVRARAALTLAIAHAATGGSARLFAHERAVRHFADLPDGDAATLAATGLPDLPQLRAMADDTSVAMIACQTGMALEELTMADFATGVEAGGLISLLSTLNDDRLVVI